MPLDFSNQNLQGRNFKGKNLIGANFRSADIRGASFSKADLSQANFQETKAGLQGKWALFLLFIASAFAFLATFSSAATNGITWWRFNSRSPQQDALIFGIATFGLIAFFLFIFIWKGFSVGLRLLLAILLGSASIAGALQAIKLQNGFYLWSTAIAAILTIGLVVSISVAEAIMVATYATTSSLGGLVIIAALAGGLAGAVARVASGNGLDALSSNPPWSWNWAWVDLMWAWGWSWLLVGLGSFVSWHIHAGEQSLLYLRQLPIAIATLKSTSFYKANLTDADFTFAIVRNTDFRSAKLTRTYWYKATGLESIRSGTDYLSFSTVRNLVTTLQSQDESFDYLNLNGINLKNANLKDSSFMNASLVNANFQAADLSRVVLKQAQLDSADLTGATLTGAYIEDWGITTETKLDGVRCEYVYMRVPTKDDPDPLRKPDNRNEVFEDGDFADFIRPIVETLDLYHNQGVDPRAIAISFKKLAEDYPEAKLEIVAMEKRGQDKFLLRTKTASTADKSLLSAEYFATYSQIKNLPEAHVRILLAEQYVRARNLENMVETALQRPSFYSHVERAETVSHNPISISGSSGVNIAQGDRNVQGENIQAVTGDHSQAQQNQDMAEDEPLTKEDVLALLVDLETLIRGSDLSEETKEEASTYLKAAQKATEKEEPKKQAILTNLESMTETLTEASKSVEAGKTLWQNAQPILIKVVGWLGGIAAGSLLAGL